VDSAASLSSPQAELLRLEGMVKHFGGVVALAGVDLVLRRGVIHGLVGENGAGKSTLIKIICGIERADAGRMWLDGKAYMPLRPIDAKKNGIQVVHQELNLLTLMSVSDNVCFEHIPRNRWGIVRKQEQERQTREALQRVGLEDIDLSQPIERLGIARQQLIEIARALKSQSRILILDEPTATLTAIESANLFRILHELASLGVAILLVSHHLDEIMEHCDEVTVMRNGATVASYAIAEASINRMIGDMVEHSVGQDATVIQPPPPPQLKAKTALELKNFRVKASPHQQGINLVLKKGEILGVAGLVGAGRTELLRAVAGVDKPVSGYLLRDDKSSPSVMALLL